jgi:hypothetical protein
VLEISLEGVSTGRDECVGRLMQLSHRASFEFRFKEDSWRNFLPTMFNSLAPDLA